MKNIKNNKEEIGEYRIIKEELARYNINMTEEEIYSQINKEFTKMIYNRFKI